VAEQLGEAVLSIRADTAQLDAGLQRARQGLRSVEQDTASAVGGFDRLGASLGQLVGQLALLETARRVAVFTGQQVQELDAAQAAVRTLGVDSTELTSRLRALSTELGSNVSVIELTKAAYDVASSGFASAGDATQVLRAASLGAQGGFAELNDVVRAVTGVLNAYGLSADQATNIVDTFLQTQNDGVITVRQYAAEIGNVASIAAAGGVSLKELNAAIATATLRGVPVAQTFTGIRQALASIIKPSQQATDLAKSLGLDYSVTALQTKGFAGVLQDVQQKTGGAADKLAILLGSVEAQAAIQPLLNDKLAKYNELLGKQAQAAGQAGKASEINSKTISGGLKQIGNGFSNLATTLDTTLKPIFGGLIGSLNEILTKLNQVSALAPEKVLAREKQAKDLVQQALGPFGGSGFFGSVTVKFEGKTFKGSARGVLDEITKYLLNKELAALNKPAPASTAGGRAGTPAGAPPKPPAPTPDPAAVAAAAETQRKAQAQQALNAITAQGLQQELAYKRQLLALELQSLRTGEGISATTRVQLENQQAILAARRQVAQAQAAVDAELAKPAGERSSAEVDNLLAKVAEANAGVRKAYLDAGISLVQNARTAADALKGAQSNLQGVLRGGFEFIGPRAQQGEIDRARASIQPLVDRGLIREGIDISTPERLFRVAAFAEQLAPAQKQLEDAVRENATATKALADKDWNVYVSTPTQPTPVPLPRV
jgi:TP901 family phage tail tape measure protein